MKTQCSENTIGLLVALTIMSRIRKADLYIYPGEILVSNTGRHYLNNLIIQVLQEKEIPVTSANIKQIRRILVHSIPLKKGGR